MTVEGDRWSTDDGRSHRRRGRWAARRSERARRLRVWVQDARQRHQALDVSLEVAQRERRLATSVLAGGLAYRFFFWLLPFTLVLGAALGFISASDSAKADDLARDAGLSAVAAETVADAAKQAERGRWVLLAVGVVLLLWASYWALRALRLVSAVVWDLVPSRLRRPLTSSFGFAVGLSLLVATVTVAGRAGQVLGAAGVLVALTPLPAVFAAWMGVLWLLPRRDVSWRDLVPGAAVGTAGVLALHLVTVFYLAEKLVNASALYGALGLASVLLLWLYLVARLLVASLIVTETLDDRRRRGRYGS